jgi:hypothetical protein
VSRIQPARQLLDNEDAATYGFIGMMSSQRDNADEMERDTSL